MDTSRKRIIYFIENQRIKPSEFLKKTELKKGFIDKSHQDSGASDLFLSKILENYPELSAEWLLTGKGKMIKEEKNEHLNSEKSTFKEHLNDNKLEPLKKDLENARTTLENQKYIIDLQKDKIENLNQEVQKLKSEIELLKDKE
ncbi:hypothetical protein SGQ83_19715 [Flavobacterium sp. Fl-318]|uniref:HTH cro/C1-type domain-containing protein n=1 Tax=Flavobacterium cupriresistens TaxID=2893885 RepID=A0ABU4RG92_9FLAO|nr:MULTISPECIES: hypothetical protein [unclassified Flavobacterium]MDX6191592.1 hypothetical protein [Flavobacterium sp. Fl-318]UFH41539.1 hypothetical protein LNP23_17180 [Flavobacterium sp. F-323]